MARGLVAFRTHIWDDGIAAMARRLYLRRGDWDFAVLADETRAVLDTTPYRKISHTEDFSDLGLPRSGNERELWYNSDYSFYRLLGEPHDYFCISEYDVFADADVGAILRRVVEERLDALTSGVAPAEAHWYHRATAQGAYAVPHRSFNPFIVLSRRALEQLLQRRQLQAQRWRRGEFAQWPYFEAFVGSELALAERLRRRELGEVVSLAHYSWGPAFSVPAAERLAGDQLVHPVHDGLRFVRARLALEMNPERYLDRTSALRRDLAPISPDLVVPEIFQAIARRTRERGARPRWRIARIKAHLFPRRGDLAQGRLVLRSDPAIPDDPWWAIDLGDDYRIERLALRLSVEKGAEGLRLRLQTAATQGPWRICARVEASRLHRATTLTPAFPAVARLVMLRVEGCTRLAVSSVRIFGCRAQKVGA